MFYQDVPGHPRKRFKRSGSESTSVQAARSRSNFCQRTVSQFGKKKMGRKCNGTSGEYHFISHISFARSSSREHTGLKLCANLGRRVARNLGRVRFHILPGGENFRPGLSLPQKVKKQASDFLLLGDKVFSFPFLLIIFPTEKRASE